MNSRSLKRLALRGLAMVMCLLPSLPMFALASTLGSGQSEKQPSRVTSDSAKKDVALAAAKAVEQSNGSAPSQASGAQQPPAPSQLDRSTYQPSAQRVGVDTNQALKLLLRDAVVMALNKNLDIAVQRYNVKEAEYDLLAARGVYDVIPGATLRTQSNTQPTASLFAGGGRTGAVSSKTNIWNLFVRQVVPGGGNYQVSWNNNRTGTTSSNTTLNPQFVSTISASATQPILKNFRFDQNARQISIAKKRLDISDMDFRQRAIDTINSVQKAYWDLVFAIKNETIKRDSLDLAVTQLDNNKKREEAGDLAPIEIVQAEATVESRKQDVILALQQVTVAENNLKGLILNDPESPLWNASLQPTDEAKFTPSVYSLDEATRLALMNRTDLQNLKYQTQLNEIDLKYFHNQMKPQFDVVGQFTGNGLGGKPSGFTFGGPGGTSLVPKRFIGDAGTAISNAFGFDFRSWSIGLDISFPVRNRTARAQYGRALAEARKLDLQQKQAVQRIQIDVRNAMQAVESARQRIEAARSGRVNAEVQLKGEEEKYRAGLSSTFFVLQRQTDLSQARGTELQALTDYNKAIADLQRAMSTTLDSAGVTITHDVVTQQDQTPVKKP